MEYIRRHTPLDPLEICGLAIEINCFKTMANTSNLPKSLSWKIHIPIPKSNIYRKPNSKIFNKSGYFVQISDLHFDPYYTQNATADCELYLCCRADSGMTNDPLKQAKYYGDYRHCDSPLQLIELTLNNLVKRHKNVRYCLANNLF